MFLRKMDMNMTLVPGLVFQEVTGEWNGGSGPPPLISDNTRGYIEFIKSYQLVKKEIMP